MNDRPTMANAYPAFPPLNGEAPNYNIGPKRPLNFPCSWNGCDRMFACPHNVEQHIREAHTGERPYECGRCGTAFARPFALYRHLKGIHGVENAGPGRGRGGGLERIGIVEGARVKKIRGRRGGRGGRRGGANTVGERGLVQLAEAVGMPLAMSQQLEPGPKQNPTFEVNNFTLNPTACACGERFDNREAFLSHLHLDHDQAPSPSCNCMICIDQFGGPVDGAGVHAFERSAATMHGLMADDLFAPGGLRDAMMMPGMMGERTGAGVDMSDEEFTKNMHVNVEPSQQQQQPGQPPSMLEAQSDAMFAANMPQDDLRALADASTQEGQAQNVPFNPLAYGEPDQAAVDDWDVWMKTAEEVFGGGGDDSEKGQPMSGVQMAESERLMGRLE